MSAQNSKELRKLILSSQHETNATPDWYSHPKHIFVFTWTGKPLFTRYGNDNKLVEIIGTISAFVTNFAEMLQNPLISFQAGTYTFVILNKEPLFLFCVTRTKETVSQILIQLSLLYHQLISILTNNIIQVLRDDPGYDPREQLGGTDLLTHSLISDFDTNLPLLTQTLPTIRIPKNTRVKLLSTLKKFKLKDNPILFTILLVNGKMVALIKNKPISTNSKDPSTPSLTTNHLFSYDLSMLFNMIVNQPSLRTSEAWTPICLPFSNPRELSYVYTQYIPIPFNKGEKMFDVMINANNQLNKTIYPTHQQEGQGVMMTPLTNDQPTYSFSSSTTTSLSSSTTTTTTSTIDTIIPNQSFSISSDVCLLTVASHPLFFPKCQSHASSIISYLESHSSETKMSEYLAALLSNQLTKTPFTQQSPSPMISELNLQSQPILQQQSSISTQQQQQQPQSTILSSPSFTQQQLQSQTVHLDPYLLDSIRSKCCLQLAQYLESNISNSKSSISLLHELHYFSLPTSNSRVYPWEIDIYDPKAPPPYCTPTPPTNSQSTTNTNMQLHLHSDLSHFAYIDLKTNSILESEAMRPFRYLTTTGVSISVPDIPQSTITTITNTNNDTTSSPSTTTTKLSIPVPPSPTTSSTTIKPSVTDPHQYQTDNNNNGGHITLIARSKYLDSANPLQPIPFNLGGHGVVSVTTTQQCGLYPQYDPTPIIIEGAHNPKLIPDYDFTRIPIAPCITAVNTLAAHISITDRYKQLHAKTHLYNNPRFHMKSNNNDDYNEYDSFADIPTILPSQHHGLTNIDTYNNRLISKKPYLNSSQNPYQTLQQQSIIYAESPLTVTEPITFVYTECHDAIIVYQTKIGLYELYCTFPPLTSKESIANTMHRLVLNIQKEYDSFFGRVINV